MIYVRPFRHRRRCQHVNTQTSKRWHPERVFSFLLIEDRSTRQCLKCAWHAHGTSIESAVVGLEKLAGSRFEVAQIDAVIIDCK